MKPNPRYTRVTDVLYPFSGLQYIDGVVLENAALRGTRVHAACEAIVSGEGAWDLDDVTKGYVQSFETWWGDGRKVASIEQRFHCDELMITGQVDLILETDHGHTILDLKTSQRPSKTWPLQGAAYAYLARANGYNVTAIQFLQLMRSGDDPIIHEYSDDLDLFLKTLTVYRYFFKSGGVKDVRCEPLDPSRLGR